MQSLAHIYSLWPAREKGPLWLLLKNRLITMSLLRQYNGQTVEPAHLDARLVTSLFKTLDYTVVSNETSLLPNLHGSPKMHGNRRHANVAKDMQFITARNVYFEACVYGYVGTC